MFYHSSSSNSIQSILITCLFNYAFFNNAGNFKLIISVSVTGDVIVLLYFIVSPFSFLNSDVILDIDVLMKILCGCYSFLNKYIALGGVIILLTTLFFKTKYIEIISSLIDVVSYISLVVIMRFLLSVIIIMLS